MSRFSRHTTTRSAADLATASRMLALLKKGSDQREKTIAAARKSIAAGKMDTPMKLSIALDRMIEREVLT